MATPIIDGRGSGNRAGVDSASRLLTTGSITSMPSISVAADPATTKVGDAGLGSASLVGAYDGAADIQALRIVNGSHLLIAGSISSLPSIFTSEASVVKDGTETLGSSTIIGGMWNGSMFPVRIDNGSHVMTAGSIVTMPTIGISGIEDIGSVVIKSAPLIGVSGLVFTQGNIVGSFAQKGIGSIVIKSAPLIGVSGAIFDSGDITGSMVISQSTKLGVSGIVEVSNRVAGSIVNMPDINVTEDSVAKIGTEHLGSGAVVGGVSNGSMFPFIMALGSFALTAGSITHIPTTTVIATNLDIRDLSSASDSVSTVGSVQVNAGSVRSQAVQITNPWIVLGSTRMIPGADLPITGSVKVLSHTGSLEVFQTTNSDMQVQATQEGTWNIAALTAGSVQVNAGSITIGRTVDVSGSKLDKLVGSMHVPNRVAGSIVNMPSVVVTSTNLDIRDLDAATDKVGIGISTGSVEVFQTVNADMQVQATQEGTWNVGTLTSITNRVAGSIVNLPPVLGSISAIERTVDVSGGIFTGGDLTGSVSLQGIGSVIISSAPLIGVSGLIFTEGNLTGSVSLQGVGSIYVSNIGSIGQAAPAKPFIIEPIRDTFGFSGATFIGSFTGSRMILPGTGSKIFLKGFNISAELASKCRIFFSGTAAGNGTINIFNLPNSGTVAMNLLGMEPSGGVNQPITIGKFDTGSIHVTVFSRDSL